MNSLASWMRLADAGRTVRCCLKILLGLMGTSKVGAASTPTPWFNRLLVGMEVGPTGAQFAGGIHAPDNARNFNGAEIVRRCAAANAEYLVLWVRDGDFTFHNSKWVAKPASFGERDVLREAVEEGRKLNLPIIPYCQLQHPAHELRQHPEWKARQANGEPMGNANYSINTSLTGDSGEVFLAALTEFPFRFASR